MNELQYGHIRKCSAAIKTIILATYTNSVHLLIWRDAHEIVTKGIKEVTGHCI